MSSTSISTRPVWIVGWSRTPFGSFLRTLSAVPPRLLAAHAMINAVRRAKVDPALVDYVVAGHGFQNAYSLNIARDALVKDCLPFGWSESTPAHTVQQQCASGMLAVNEAMDLIRYGRRQLVVAVGVESMSMAPYLVPGELRSRGFLARKFKQLRLGPYPVICKLAESSLAPTSMLADRPTFAMGLNTQSSADAFGVSRADADRYALLSQERAFDALKRGRFAAEIDRIMVPGKGIFQHDEHIRGTKEQNPKGGTSLKTLGKLPPQLGTRDITAGNASGMGDGACALVLASDAMVEKLGLNPIARLVEHEVVALDHRHMGLGPVPAVEKLLARLGLGKQEIDQWEINEAFAAQVVAVVNLLGLSTDVVNLNGGGIAITHPIGASGTRIVMTLALDMVQKDLKRGVAAICVGGGIGRATYIER